jgi:hypothetical protein
MLHGFSDRETLWRIWDILHLWNDAPWTSNELAWVSDEMMRWAEGRREVRPPHYLRAHDEEMYEKGIGEE